MEKKTQRAGDVVVAFPATASSGGYKSGRSFDRDTPDTRSISSACSAGGLPSLNHACIVPWDRKPKALASASCPPTALHASSNADLLMSRLNEKNVEYVNERIVESGAKNKRMGRRVEYPASEFWVRLEEAIGDHYPEFNPSALARKLRMSQGTIHTWYLGNGLPKLKRALQLAREGGVCVDWLLNGVKPKYAISKSPEIRELVDVCEQLGADGLQVILRNARNELLAQRELERQQAEADRRATGTHGRR